MNEPKEQNEMTEQSVVHTPGPWRVYHYADHHPHAGCPSCVGQDDDLGMAADDVCKISRIGNKDVEWANARLIAAAPELLEALQMVLGYGSHRENDNGESVSFYVEEAIRKATEVV